MNDELNGQGQFRGDFSRDTHDPLMRFSRVLMQQGRVMLDADWNEQTSILLRFLRTLAADLIGPYGGNGFSISAAAGDTDFTIGEGHYYVNGMLCENILPTDGKGSPIALSYYAQPNYPVDRKNNPLAQVDASGKALSGLAYLDVWERHVTFNETGDSDSPGIREVALGGPDTASRAQIVWQVKVAGISMTSAQSKQKKTPLFFQKILSDAGIIRPPGTAGRLQARAKKPTADGSDCPCVISPESRYRGVENQLYRVEIHNAGGVWDDKAAAGANFKWSRENGSVVFPILKSSGNQMTVANLGRDQRLGLQVHDWVEVVDDDQALLGKANPLLQVTDIDAASLVVTLSGTPVISSVAPLTKHPLLRRWDSAKGFDPVAVATLNDGWLPLEDGVEIKFSATGTFQTGDYWLIPARVATGDVEWPGPVDAPASLPPHGIQHYYAPLAILAVDASGKVTADPTDCRSLITPVATP